MAKNKTTETSISVDQFIDAVKDEVKRQDSYSLIQLIKKQTGLDPKMWGPSIIGFGKYHYKYASGHEGDAPLAAFSPRKDSLVFYLNTGAKDHQALLSVLGKVKNTRGCVYVKKLEDIDLQVLKEMIRNSVEQTKKLYPS